MQRLALLLLALSAIACNDSLILEADADEVCEGQDTQVTVTIAEVEKGAGPTEKYFLAAFLPDGTVLAPEDPTVLSREVTAEGSITPGRYWEVPVGGLTFVLTPDLGTAGQAVTFNAVSTFLGRINSLSETSLEIPVVECDVEPEPEPEVEPLLWDASVTPASTTCGVDGEVVVSVEASGDGADETLFFFHIEAPAGVEVTPNGNPASEEWDPDELPAGTWYELGPGSGNPELELSVRYDDEADCRGESVPITVTVADRNDSTRSEALEVNILEAGQSEGATPTLHMATVPTTGDPADACASETDQFGGGHDKRINVAGGAATYWCWSVTDTDWDPSQPGFVSGLLGDALSVCVAAGESADILVAALAGGRFTVRRNEGETRWEQSHFQSGGALNIEGNADGSVDMTSRFGVDRITVNETESLVNVDRLFLPGAAPDQFGKRFGGAYQVEGDIWISVWASTQDGTCTWVTHDKSNPNLYVPSDELTEVCVPTRTTCRAGFCLTTDTENDKAFLCDATDPTALGIQTFEVADLGGDCCGVQVPDKGWYWYLPTANGICCIHHDAAGTVISEGMLDLPVGTSSEYCTAHVFSDGTFVLYYDIAGTNQCGFVVADGPVDSTDDIEVETP